MRRRQIISFMPKLGAAAMVSAFSNHVYAQDNSIVIGCSAPLTGPLASAGISIKETTDLVMSQINARGGVNGRKLKFQMMDDAYVPSRSVENVKAMLADSSIVALQTCVGTPNNAATLGMIEAAGIASLAPLTGASSLRKSNVKNLFHIRASYTEEAERLVQRLVEMGLKDIAVLYLDNPYGTEFLGDVNRVLQTSKLKSVAEIPVAVDGKNVNEAVVKALASKPSVVLLGTAGAASGSLISALKKMSPGLPIASISVVLTPQVAKALGAAGSGMALTSVLPNVNSGKMPIVREYQAAMREGGITEFSGTGLEAYMNMRVMMAALERVGRGELTRAKLRTAIATLPKIDLGGFSVDFPQGSPFVGSHFVELGVLGSNGKMLV